MTFYNTYLRLCKREKWKMPKIASGPISIGSHPHRDFRLAREIDFHVGNLDQYIDDGKVYPPFTPAEYIACRVIHDITGQQPERFHRDVKPKCRVLIRFIESRINAIRPPIKR